MMKKLLLSLLAVMGTMTASAHVEGDYLFTEAQRFKVTGENLLANGDLANGTTNWTDADGNPVSAEAWSVVAGEGPDGLTALTSMGADQNGSFCQAVAVTPGTQYAVSFWIKGPSIAASTATLAYINMDGTFTKGNNTAEAPVISVINNCTYSEEWTEVTAVITPDDSLSTKEGMPMLVIRIGALPTDVSIANFSVNVVQEVYDVRILERKIAFARMLMDDANFNTADAAGAREELAGTIELLEEMIAGNQIDDIGEGEGYATSFEENMESFMAVNTSNMANQMTGIDILALGAAGRGRTISGLGTADNGITLEGGNWGHLANTDYLMSAIQSGMSNNTHTAKYNANNSNLPAGKYFFSAEIRNANTTKDAWPCPNQTFDLETTCTVTLGAATEEVTIVGQEYKRFYIVGEVTEDGAFHADVYWPGPGMSKGGAFYIRDVRLRSFGDTEAKAAHLAAWKAFKAQYDAALNARNTIVEMQGDANYPWSKAKLQEALDTYDPFFTPVQNWVTTDGEDSGEATTEELDNWAKYQGGEVPEDGKATYYVVRGYQAAINAVKADNQSISDINAAIVTAKETLNDPFYSASDDATLTAAIATAEEQVNTVKANATDETKEADDATLAQALQTLNAAVEQFIAAHQPAPIADIDFSNSFADNGDGTYSIAGAAGAMTFNEGTIQPDNTIADYCFALGFNGELNDVLHVGGDSYGSVALPTPGDEDVLRITFDLWYGQLGKAYQEILLLNAEGTRVAGFSFDSYTPDVRFNDFDNEQGTGMVIKGKAKSNHDKSGGPVSVCTDALRNSFTLLIDYKAGTVQGKMVNSSNTVNGVAVPLNAELADNKIVTFQVGGYNHAKANGSAYGRRAWFDNLKIFKYGSNAGNGIESVNSETAASTAAIYTINGVQVKSASKPGLYIQNGKKFVVK